MKQSTTTIMGRLGKPNQVDTPYRVGSLNLSRPGLQSPAVNTVTPRAFLLSMPIIKHFGSCSHRHSFLLRNARHLSKYSTLYFFSGILMPSALMGFHAQIVGTFSTATRPSPGPADVSALIKHFGSSATDTAAEAAYIPNQRSRLSLSEAGIGESWLSFHLLLLPNFLPSSATAVQFQHHFSHGCGHPSTMAWARSNLPMPFVCSTSYDTT